MQFNDPGTHLRNVTPSDSVDLPNQGFIILATGGVIKLTDSHGDTDTVTLPAGLFPCRVKRVWAAGLTATGITLIWQ